MALAYEGLLEVEASFRTLKTPVEIHPVYHGSELGLRGHIISAVMARLIEGRLEEAGIPQRASTARPTLADIDGVEMELGGRRLGRVARLTDEQRRLGEALQVPPLPVFRVP